tara:strand:+ start:2184 stop:3266 length:1083 start_codon:yes stop_codon:yes gene_type:complete
MNGLKSFISITFVFVFFINSPYLYATVLLERVGQPLQYPWGMDFLSHDELLITERPGRIVKVVISTGKTTLVTGVPKVFARGQGGLLDVVVDKNDKEKETNVYFCYSFRGPKGIGTAIDKGVLKENKIINIKSVFISNHLLNSRKHFGCRLLLIKDNLFATLGDRGKRDSAQDEQNHSGSVIRILLNKGGKSKLIKDITIFSIGHRNPQGLALNPNTNQIWSHEHGPKGGDEINILKKGKNYGWPIITSGKEYLGGKIGIGTSSPTHVSPIWSWTPSIAPSGMAFYNKTMFNEFKGHLLVGSLKFRTLYLVKLKNDRPISENIVFKNKIGRIRDVAVSKDGSILLLTDEREGGLYRLFKE